MDELIQQALPDLPGYANRVRTRNPRRRLGEKPSQVLLAKQLELQSLPPEFDLGQQERWTQAIDADINGSQASDIEVVFITTWERWYEGQRSVEAWQFHWVFLESTEAGWVIVKMFSKYSPYPGRELLPLVRDSTDDTMAEALRLWLRDCQAR
ncbi:MAG: hypothetical protein ACFBSC_14250 [Microcoleaceae cyanobacterium]